MVIGGLIVAKWAVKDEADMNMDRLVYEDEVPVQDKVPAREEYDWRTRSQWNRRRIFTPNSIYYGLI